MNHQSMCLVPYCGWKSGYWNTNDAAGCAATWHVYLCHSEIWQKLVGVREPLDPKPHEVGIPI